MGKVRLALLVAVLLYALPAYGQSQSPTKDVDSHWVHAAISGLAIAFFTDLSTTEYCLGARTCREVNPLLRGFTKNPAGAGIVKGAVAVGVTRGLLHVHKTHPKVALVTAIGLGAFTGAVAWHNGHAIAEQQKK